MNTQVEPDHYYKNYDTKERFCSYWHQIQEILSLNPKNTLEIGIGNGFVSKYLKQRGFNVITLNPLCLRYLETKPLPIPISNVFFGLSERISCI